MGYIPRRNRLPNPSKIILPPNEDVIIPNQIKIIKCRNCGAEVSNNQCDYCGSIQNECKFNVVDVSNMNTNGAIDTINRAKQYEYDREFIFCKNCNRTNKFNVNGAGTYKMPCANCGAECAFIKF